MMKKAVVIGIGNILLKDDGIGIHIINNLINEYMNEMKIECIDGGTQVIDLLAYFLEYQKVIIIDCLRGGHEPGTVYKITPKELQNFKKENLSLHDVQVLDVIKQANLIGFYPEVTIIGIEPEEISYSLELSDKLNQELQSIVKTTIELINEVLLN